MTDKKRNKVMIFNYKKWFKPDIDLTTELRSEVKNELQENVCKLSTIFVLEN